MALRRSRLRQQLVAILTTAALPCAHRSASRLCASRLERCVFRFQTCFVSLNPTLFDIQQDRIARRNIPSCQRCIVMMDNALGGDANQVAA